TTPEPISYSERFPPFGSVQRNPLGVAERPQRRLTTKTELHAIDVRLSSALHSGCAWHRETPHGRGLAIPGQIRYV
ncbi:MAG TPA: hypothetical protein VM580_03795, partial [Labilithrix sp.]|nr:hypothetical protein [Labilithrix sp.]